MLLDSPTWQPRTVANRRAMKNRENNISLSRQPTTKSAPSSNKLGPPSSCPLQLPFFQSSQGHTPSRTPLTNRQFASIPPPSPTPRSPLRASAPDFNPILSSPVSLSQNIPGFSAIPTPARGPLAFGSHRPRSERDALAGRSPTSSPRLIPVYYAPPSRANDPPSPVILPPPSSRDALASPRYFSDPTEGIADVLRVQTETLVHTYSHMIWEGVPRACIGTWVSRSDGLRNRADSVYAMDDLQGALLSIVLAVEDALPYARQTPVVVLTMSSAALAHINTNTQPKSGTAAYHIHTLLALSGAQISFRLADEASKDEVTRKLRIGARALARAMSDARPENVVLNAQRRRMIMERMPRQEAPQRPLPTPISPMPSTTKTTTQAAIEAKAQVLDITSIYVSGRLHDDGTSALIGMWHGENNAHNMSGRFACMRGGARMATILAVAAGVEAAARLGYTDGGSSEVEVMCAELESDIAAAITSLRSTTDLVDCTDAEAEAIRHIWCKLSFASNVRVRSKVGADTSMAGILGARALGNEAQESHVLPGRWLGGKVEVAVAVEKVATAEIQTAIVQEDLVVVEETKEVEPVDAVDEVATVIGGQEMAFEQDVVDKEQKATVDEKRPAIRDAPDLHVAALSDMDVVVEVDDGVQPPLPKAASAGQHARDRLGLPASLSLLSMEGISAHRPSSASSESLSATVHALHSLASTAYASMVTSAPRAEPSDKSHTSCLDDLVSRTREVIDIWTSEKERWMVVLPLIAQKTAAGRKQDIPHDDRKVRKAFRDWFDKLTRLDNTMWPMWPEVAVEDVPDMHGSSQLLEILEPTENIKLSKMARRRRNRRARQGLPPHSAHTGDSERSRSVSVSVDSVSALPVSSEEVEPIALPTIRPDITPNTLAVPNLAPAAAAANTNDENAVDEHYDETEDAEPLDRDERAELARAEELFSRWDDLTEVERVTAETLAQGLVRRLAASPVTAIETARNKRKKESKAAYWDDEYKAFLNDEAWALRQSEGGMCIDNACAQAGEVTGHSSQADPELDMDISMAYEVSGDDEDSGSNLSPSTCNDSPSSAEPVITLSPSTLPSPEAVVLVEKVTLDPWSAIAAYDDSSDDEDSNASSSSTQCDPRGIAQLAHSAPSQLISPPSTPRPRFVSRPIASIASYQKRISPGPMHGMSPVTPAQTMSSPSSSTRSGALTPLRYMDDVHDVQRKAERLIPLTPREEALLEKHSAWTAALSKPSRLQSIQPKDVGAASSRADSTACKIPLESTPTKSSTVLAYINPLLYLRPLN